MADEVAFDLQSVANSFSGCKQEDGTILIDKYIEAYEELCRFFELLGSVFSFVVSDVRSKIHILQDHRKSPVGEHYVNVQGMLQYELDNDIINKNKVSNGSRTLLRLHRALEFIMKFLDVTQKAPDDASTATLASTVYKATLYNHHTYLVGKGALLAMYIPGVLPSKKGLLTKIKKYDYATTNAIVKEIIEKAEPIYEITQQCYEEKDFLKLP